MDGGRAGNTGPAGQHLHMAGSTREAQKVQTEAEALLVVSEHLLAWGKTQWTETAAYGRNERLRFLWLWGANRGLGRLV